MAIKIQIQPIGWRGCRETIKAPMIAKPLNASASENWITKGPPPNGESVMTCSAKPMPIKITISPTRDQASQRRILLLKKDMFLPSITNSF
jgi:hypothetical protein